ncbi:hypothetical protein OG2516_06781 [Oceanicola granulosus HTCC2516]|uniref:Flagellar protein FlgJ N-terminal domain-containing protein n=1 Tax=Oceanicola granulosus (strain ATCC BAA-861 / DSM 15982 / KCTC 12143 / HTCC2516) TaxID=314256 RepID=Q2CGH0_OCEGH|nr:rod-binding protein [Oceanicola granulosus]EAR51748.1 hypothetical protein OG2516_06781 [Oceanicola granulosus HTCC2516]
MEAPADGIRQPLPASSAARPRGAGEAEARKIAVEFEAVFLTQAVEQMMSTVEGGIFGGGHAEETWRGFLSRAFAEEVAKGGTTGIATSIETAINAYQSRITGGDEA